MPTEVKYWKLDAGTGTVLTDSSANAIQGWWYGGSATYMRWNTGLFGSSITFDGGVADFSWIRGNSAGTLTVASASISLWMCMPVTYQADGAVAEFRTSNPDNASYTLEVGSTAQLWLRKTDGGGTTNLVGPTTTALNDGQWHHVVFTLDNANSKAKIYVDGVLDAVSTSYSSTEDPYHVRFGSRATSPAAWYSGRIDEILTYDQPLNQLHVTYLFSKGPGPCTPSTMHIEEIECDLFSVPGNRNKGMATVKVYDNCVGLVSGATVTGTFTGDYTDAGMSAVTDDAGRAVILTVQEQPGQGNFFTFCVDSVTHGSYSHAQGEDLESCDTN